MTEFNAARIPLDLGPKVEPQDDHRPVSTGFLSSDAAHALPADIATFPYSSSEAIPDRHEEGGQAPDAVELINEEMDNFDFDLAIQDSQTTTTDQTNRVSGGTHRP